MERWIVVTREKDKSHNGIYFKHLDLLTPKKAFSEHGLQVEHPILVCHRNIG